MGIIAQRGALSPSHRILKVRGWQKILEWILRDFDPLHLIDAPEQCRTERGIKEIRNFFIKIFINNITIYALISF